MSELSGLWKHENNPHALVPPKTECNCPSGGGIKNGLHTLPLLWRNAEEEDSVVICVYVSDWDKSSVASYQSSGSAGALV